MNKQEFSELIKKFKIREIFNELGWNNDRAVQILSIYEKEYTFKSVADKCGLKVLTCETDKLPDIDERRKIDIQLRKLFFHYILIIKNENEGQKWIVPVTKVDKRELVTTDYISSQVPEFLFQKVSELTFSIEQEEKLTIVDVSKIVNDVFIANSEKITKQFFEKFKKEHTTFLSFIKGIEEKADREWYASLMLNRLMFCYFIQKKGFLDDNKNYLQDKLEACIEKRGRNKFYSFYRDFLLVLFHEGLNEPERKKEIQIEIGRIPYLNGGLFDVHELEKLYGDIAIEDRAFERIFNFFDEYEWHLDTRITSSGKEINPDVIGYIFEKYINDRADMGAYYTKEDITEYISKNTILPYLFEESKRKYNDGFGDNGRIWEDLKKSGDRYIYESIKKGTDKELPKDIEKGVKKVKERGEWNKPADEEYALPTEIWRETVERRQRYKELSDKIEEGNIKSINDFIKYNLNIRKFAADILESTNDSKIIQIFYTALKEITILDPTCGSGAFLFAAMNILEPLYEICIDRMQYFIEKDGRGKHKKFEEILKEIKAPEHPNLEYYIYKNIILNNIFGVDIMNEAVEIAKLRLFLKLASLVEVDHSKRNMGLEPLPDIDFNIKSGNTLIGFPTIDEAVRIINEKDKPGQLGLNMSNEISVVNTLIDQTDDYAMIIKSYKSAQIKECYSTNKVIKEKINSKKDFINQTANKYLAFTYSGFNKKKNNYDKWVKTVKPFHWFSEFHDNVESGGFDVVIGNPPYVESKGVEYPTNGFKTAECGNLYAYVLERIKLVMKKNGYCGMIVPLSGHSTERMNNLVKYFYKEFNINYFFNISADANPSKIFEDVKFRLSIFIITNGDANIQVTKYRRWYSDERKNLFETIKYTRIGSNKLPGIIEKISADIHNSILEKILNKKINHTTGNKDFITYYHNAPVNWIRAHEFVPYFNSERDGTKLSTQLKPLGCDTEEIAKAMSAVLCSTLFYIWWITFSDCYHLNKSDIVRFKFNFGDLKIISELSLFYNKLKKDMLHNAKRRVYYYKNSGRVEYDEFYMKKSKPIIDEIDTILAKHYGFTEEELDFIINYDIKYRMGSELENEG